MWVFIDDSGDTGFKFDQGSSSHLVMAAAVFYERSALEHAVGTIKASRYTQNPVTRRIHERCREYKYAKTNSKIKDSFFAAIGPCDFAVRVIHIDKSKIHSPYLLDNPGDMKAYLIRQMLTHTFGQIRDAKLVIDGHDTRAFGMGSDKDYLTRMVGQEAPGTLSGIEFADSTTSEGVQLADMIAGSYRSHLETALDPSKQDKFEEAGRHVASYLPKTYQPRGSRWNFTR